MPSHSSSRIYSPSFSDFFAVTTLVPELLVRNRPFCATEKPAICELSNLILSLEPT